jgi:serine-type D-Ala-D-Ala carboxypeptidase (penicillin-binding protein 5/6)
MPRLIRATAAVLLLCTLAVRPASAQPPPLTLEVSSAILIDFTTGQVLYEQDADQAHAPASLTKLMTLHLAFRQLESGKMRLDEKVNISRNAWAQNPTLRGSSLMFLEPGMNVTVGEILKGIAIPSGNDASLAIAEHIAGTEQAFLAMMNEEARSLGFQVMTFYDSHGLSPQSRVTAREMAAFARLYVRAHPNSLAELHSQKEYQFPQWEHLPKERQEAIGAKERFQPPRPQFNRNLLLGSFAGADGLKTGFIDESGYHLLATAERGGMRLIGLVMGAKDERHREEQALALMNWGFRNWHLVRPAKVWEQAQPLRVWKGAADQVPFQAKEEVAFVVQAGDQNRVEHRMELPAHLVAPVAAGQRVGTLVYTVGERTVFTTDLVAAESVAPGGLFKRVWDALRLWAAGLMQRR